MAELVDFVKWMQYELHSGTKLIPEWNSFWYHVNSPLVSIEAFGCGKRKVLVLSLLHSRSPCKRHCFRHIRGSRIFLSNLQTHMHMQTSLASFILIISRVISREHTLLLHGLLLIPHLHSLRHSTPRPFGYYWFSFLFVVQALLHEHDTTWKRRKDPNPKRHTLQNIDYMQKYPNIVTYRCSHYGDETCFRDLSRDQIRDERWPTRTCTAHDTSALTFSKKAIFSLKNKQLWMFPKTCSFPSTVFSSNLTWNATFLQYYGLLSAIPSRLRRLLGWLLWFWAKI